VVVLNKECLQGVLLCKCSWQVLRFDYKHLFFNSRDYYFV
jgi:hypothetical protein